MEKQPNIAELLKRLEQAEKDKERLERESYLLQRQLELKDQHLSLLLEQAPAALTAFNKEGFIELHIGKGLEIPGADTKTSSFIGMHIDMLKPLMPNVVQAVYKAFEGVVTNAQTTTPNDNVFHSIYVPVKHHDQVEYVYSVSFRWPNEEELSPYMYKSELDMDAFNNL